MLISPNYLMEVSHLFAGVARWVPARKKTQPLYPFFCHALQFLGGTTTLQNFGRLKPKKKSELRHVV